ncbi:MAG: amino acid racemase [Roseibium sp.]|uniref:aspartate/glutamate racemase family protein n=1 Tax=Roseibium sp. TaxID=1936156 RepID=UPI0026346FD4|nr:amino acid racemase [Roseibium sp.]MCV0429258.1 amino acid racemase [Roseibium sp.]
MNNQKRPIGVLGGMGPEATILFMQKVVQAVPAGDDSDHVPLIVDNNTQVPSRIRALIEGTGEDPGPTLAAMARKLEKAGAEALVMPCNTAHNYREHICKAATIPFLSMVDLTVEHIGREFPGARIGILASPAVRMTNVYDTPIKDAGMTPVYPKDEAAILSAIKALKVSANDASAFETARSAASELSTEGCDVLLVSCTEFSFLANDLKECYRVIDALDVLADATVSFSLGKAVPALNNSRD